MPTINASLKGLSSCLEMKINNLNLSLKHDIGQIIHPLYYSERLRPLLDDITINDFI